ncbi:hypothetical protein NBT05_05490 [Aquimarina sp. ERC-38]|uniref:transporter n=1 Tax=Aquimarina sp. ERC-38 TaxID=2949996 RepID=UPI002246A634|nr:transporter [Aquimarina sp. ERC-38]UZO81918.1 hypothetical protein NBT05_05490 [Aquimarina sp. ERC-38]
MQSQTILNGFYPEQGNLTVAVSYGYKSNDQFFVGNSLAPGNPAMLGTINTELYNIYGEYGITDWLSGVITLPYISVESEAGVADPVQMTDKVDGIQDLGIYLKAKVFETMVDQASFKLGGGLGYSLPVGDYNGGGVLSLGNQAHDISAVAIVQYTTSYNFFTEFQGGYSIRESSDFEIPNATIFSGKLGYFNDYFYADVKLGIQNSQSGLDIGTPEFVAAGAAAALPETKVDYTELSFNIFVPVFQETLGISAGYAKTLEGRNFNDASGFTAGLVYMLR